MYKKIFRFLLVIIPVLYIGNVCAKTERQKPERASEVSESSMNTLREAINIIKNEYVAEVDEDRLVENAVNGMLASLDPHSGFYTKESIDEGALYAYDAESGIGVEITVDNGSIRVVTPTEGGSAEKAGVKAGDYIMAVDDASMYGMSTYDAMQRISGKPNSNIKLTIFREGVSSPIEFKIKRESALVNQNTIEYVDDGILYMKISNFDQNTYSAMERKLKHFLRKGSTNGIIIDLRNNPGGLISEAVKLVSMFVGDGAVVYTKGRDENSISEYHSDSDVLKMKNIPIVTLINNGTASAAEIVVGALQDHKRAIVIGTRSFGKGSVQEVIPLEGGSAMSITTSLYYTPTGRSIQVEGVVPDIIIEDIEVKKYKEDHAFREENIEGHLEGVKGMNQSRGSYAVEKIKRRMKQGKEKTCKKCKDDYMVIRAVDLVKGISIYN